MTKAHQGFIEVVIFYFLVHLVIWGSVWFHPPVLIVAVVMVGICVFSNHRHNDSKEKIGLTRKDFTPALVKLMPIGIPIALVLVVIGWGKGPQGGEWGFFFILLGYPVWSFAQEYALLGFVANRLEDGFPRRKWLVPWTNGLLFSMAHLPNPLLMPITFISGVYFTWLFQRHRNLFAIAIIHALIGILFNWATIDMKGLMSVGPAYLTRTGGWF